MTGFLIIIAIADGKTVFARLCGAFVQISLEHLNYFLHGFFPAPRNAGGKNLALLQCDERLNFQRASRNSHHFSDSSAML